MDLLYTVTFFGSIAVGLIVLGAIALAFWLGDTLGAPVFLYDMLSRQGDGAARLAVASGGRGFQLAVRQCVRCSNTTRCKAWLDGQSRESIDDFCPNAGYVSQMRGLATVAGA